MLTITMDHRFDELVKQLIDSLHQNPPALFTPQEIIIPNSAIRHYLTLQIANREKICANIQFPLLAQWMWEKVRQIYLESGDDSLMGEPPYTKKNLSWILFNILKETDTLKAYPRLFHWLKNNDELGRYELASQIAGLFEQYTIYRQEWLQNWFRKKKIDQYKDTAPSYAKEDEAWLSFLWQEIEKVLKGNGVHPFEKCIDLLKESPSYQKLLPQKVFIFCLPTIAHQYLDFLNKLSHYCDIELFVLNPSPEFWLDLVPEKKIAKFIARKDTEAHFESKNPLLANWGRQMQAQLQLLDELNIDFYPHSEPWLHKEKAPEPLLHRIQHSITYLKDLEIQNFDPTDRSLEFHVCHSMMREVEVLHDQLLTLFSADPRPNPSDVLVVTPQLDQIAPLVDAVFQKGTSTLELPYRIMGRSGRTVNAVSKAIIDLLNLATSRITALDLYDLLLQPVVSERFQLKDSLDQVYQWLLDAKICWALSGEQKEEWDLPPDDHFSVHDGLSRLFLSYAMPDDIDTPFDEKLPLGKVEGKEAETLGYFFAFIESLKALVKKLKEPQEARAWKNTLNHLLETFISEDAPFEDIKSVKENIDHLFSEQIEKESISVTVVINSLSSAFDQSNQMIIPTGSITFASISAFRNIPYQYIYAIGLNDGAFPRDEKTLEFDLMKHTDAKTGDLQRKENDRNVFLDLILSAKTRLYISYTGKDICNNAEKLPSILVSELFDYLEQSYIKSHESQKRKDQDKEKERIQKLKDEVKQQLVISHPLQAFSTDYFIDDATKTGFEKIRLEKIKSHNDILCKALNNKFTHPLTIKDRPNYSDANENEDSIDRIEIPFFDREINVDIERWKNVSLEQLISFFENPSRFILTRQLGMSFPEEQEDLPIHEPFSQDGLDAYASKSNFISNILQGKDEKETLLQAKASNDFPVGNLGNIQIETTYKEAKNFSLSLDENIKAPYIATQSFRHEFPLDETMWSLSGTLKQLREKGLFQYHYVNSNGDSGIRFTLKMWITHLFLNAMAPEACSHETTFYLKNKNTKEAQKFFLPALDQKEAIGHLENLVKLYKEGLSFPLEFIPQLSHKVVFKKEDDHSKEWDKFASNTKNQTDNQTKFYELAIRSLPFNSQKFKEIAESVFSPLKECMKGGQK